MRRQFTALAVVALLVVAGCSGGGGGDGTTTAPGDTTTAVDATTAEPIYGPPLDATEVADAHYAALEDAGSYSVESNATQELSSQNRTTATSTLIRGDLASGAVYTRTAAQQQTIEGYGFGNGTAYQRFQTNDQVQYVNASGRMGNASQYARTTIESYVGLFDFSYAGTTTENGETVHVYEAEGASELNTSAPAFGTLNESNVDAASATMHVREDGLVTLAGYDLTATIQDVEQRVDVTQRFTGVGETTVEEPSWLGEAEENVSSTQ